MALASTKLFTPLKGNGAVNLDHRIVLAPLTRNRGTEPSLCPHQDHVDYYSQRASPGGLLITEAVSISPEAVGYVSVPGIWTDEQVDAWSKVTTAVHAKGGIIFMQLWHTGRISHPSFGNHPLLRSSPHLPSVSSSARAITHPKTGKVMTTSTYEGIVDAAVPRPLGEDEVGRLCGDYVRAAKNALRAGFDGVEVHAAHGYLIDQFIQNGVNVREDRYGGSVVNRCRLLTEVCQAVQDAVGPYKFSVRLSPTTIDPRTGRQNQMYFGASCSDPDEVYAHAVSMMNGFKLAYLLLTEPRWSSKYDHDHKKDIGFSQPLTNQKYRQVYQGTLIAAGGFTPKSAAEALEAGFYDAVAFGRWFIANPDLPERIRKGAKFNVYNRSTFYAATIQGGGSEGYTDYPDLAGSIGTVGKYEQIEQDQIGSAGAPKANARL